MENLSKSSVTQAFTADGVASFGQDISRDTMRERVAAKIATAIASGILSVGDPLPSERELAASLSVSRETLRGAILILSTRGILSVVQGARTTVASAEVGDLALEAARYRDVSHYDLGNVHKTRLVLEREVAHEAAANIADETLAFLRESLANQRKCLEDPVRFLICDREFHTAIYRSSGNSVLADMAADLYSYLLDYRRQVVAVPGRIASSISDHTAIVEGLEARDAEQTALGFKVHETRIFESTKDILARRSDGARRKLHG